MELKAPRELGVLVAVLVVASRAVDGPPLWLATALAVTATVVGMLHILGAWRAWRAWRVAPSLALPALATFAAIGATHYLNDPWPVVPGLFVLAPISAILVEWTVNVELDARRDPSVRDALTEQEEIAVRRQLAGMQAETAPSDAPDAGFVLAAALLLAFLAFVAVGGLIPGALAGDTQKLTAQIFVATVALDLAIGALIGFRLAILAGLRGMAAIGSVAQYAAVAGLLGAVMTAVRAPRLVGPALLVVAVYGWSVFAAPRLAVAWRDFRRGASSAARPDGAEAAAPDAPGNEIEVTPAAPDSTV